MLRQHLVTLGSIEIVGIDHRKRLMDGVFRHQHRLRRAPRFCPSLRHFEALRNLVKFLEHVINRRVLLESGADGVLEWLFDVLADHEHNFSKTRAQGVKNRVVHQGLATRAYRINLLQAAVTAAHACGHDKESWLGHLYPSNRVEINSALDKYSTSGLAGFHIH